MRVSDFIFQVISERENTARNVFMVSGGGNMHLVDALGRNEKLQYICNHNEQACTFAAEGYARESNKTGLALVTTGPGGTNAITGVYSAWVDSIPMLVISGQVKFVTTVLSQPELPLRQLGDQEINITELVKSVTKYAVTVTDKKDIRYHLEKALYLARSGRPGPVWLDIPLDIQAAQIEPDELDGYTPEDEHQYDSQCKAVEELLKQAERPVIIAGNGVFLADACEELKELIEKYSIPVIGTFARYDIIRDDHPLNYGRYGTIGQRRGNFIVQNSDLIIAIGSRLNVRAISYNWEFFAREAKIVLVDIDRAELEKHTVKPFLKIQCDAGKFINDMLKTAPADKNRYSEWIKYCDMISETCPIMTECKLTDQNYVNSYNFFNVISDLADENAVYVFGNGTACVSSYQTLRLRGSQQVIVNSGCASMGYDLPAAIGAYFAAPDRQLICIAGDGSLQMNIQELQTAIHHKIPIKLFVFNNNGYISIRNTQNNFFKGFKVGSDAESGVSFPDIIKLADAYGFKTAKIETQKELDKSIKAVLNMKEPVVCEVMLNPAEKMEPKLSSMSRPDGSIVSKPLEDMYPFMDREMFDACMIIRKMEE
ncbi:MAG: thiamine pyrophosphate-binding protein [Deferribacterales bacterium]